MFSEQNTKSNRFISRLEQVPVKDLGAIGGFVSLDLNETQRFKFTTSSAVTFAIGGDLIYDDESFHDFLELEFIYTGQTITFPAKFVVTSVLSDYLLFKKVRMYFTKQNNIWTEQSSQFRVYSDEYLPAGNPMDYRIASFPCCCAGANKCDYRECKFFDGINSLACSWLNPTFITTCPCCTNPVCWCVGSYTGAFPACQACAFNCTHSYAQGFSPNLKYYLASGFMANSGRVFYNVLTCRNGCWDQYLVTQAMDCYTSGVVAPPITFCVDSSCCRCSSNYTIGMTPEGDFITVCTAHDTSGSHDATVTFYQMRLKAGSWPKGPQTCQLQMGVYCTMGSLSSSGSLHFGKGSHRQWIDKCTFMYSGWPNCCVDDGSGYANCRCLIGSSVIWKNIGPSGDTPTWCCTRLCASAMGTTGKQYYWAVRCYAYNQDLPANNGMTIHINIYCDTNGGAFGSAVSLCTITCLSQCVYFNCNLGCCGTFKSIDMTCDGCYLLIGFSPPCCYDPVYTICNCSCAAAAQALIGYFIYCKCTGSSAYCCTPCCLFLCCVSAPLNSCCFCYYHKCGTGYVGGQCYKDQYIGGPPWMFCRQDDVAPCTRWFNMCFSSANNCWMIDSSCCGANGFQCCACPTRCDDLNPPFSYLCGCANAWNQTGLNFFCSTTNLGCKVVNNPFCRGVPVSVCDPAYVYCQICCSCLQNCCPLCFCKMLGYPYVQGSLICSYF